MQSDICMDMGALTAFFYGFRDREKVLDILEQTTGGRLIQTYNTIGGVQADIHPDFVRKVKEFIAYMRPVLREYHEIFTGNVIAQERLKGTGVLTREDAISFGATGGTGRAWLLFVVNETMHNKHLFQHDLLMISSFHSFEIGRAHV